MNKGIHKVELGDLVRSVNGVHIDGGELFMVMDITSPVGYEWYRGNPLYIHEVTLKLWEVTELPNHTHWAPSNLYEVV